MNVKQKDDEYINKVPHKYSEGAKYTIHQTLWRINDEDEPESFIAQKVEYDDLYHSWVYFDGHGWWMQEQVYYSKIDLLEYRFNKAKEEFDREVLNTGSKVMDKYSEAINNLADK